MPRENDRHIKSKRGDGPLITPLVIGLTGGAGSGKSSVAALFQELGARVVDADRIGHRLLRQGSSCYSRIVNAFGPAVVIRGGKIDRDRLGHLVFSDARKRERLNRIVHPELVRDINNQIDKLVKKGRGPVVVDAALLVDWGLHRMMDKVIVVKAPKDIRLKRLVAKGIDPEKARGIMAAQMPTSELEKLADLVIDNSGSRRQLRKEAANVWKRLGIEVAKIRRL